MIAPGEHPFIEELSTAPSALIKAINKGIKHSYKPAFTDIDDGICALLAAAQERTANRFQGIAVQVQADRTHSNFLAAD